MHLLMARSIEYQQKADREVGHVICTPRLIGPQWAVTSRQCVFT